ncbi:CAP domain-containing protein [Streptomyces sp. t39]|uniref:CAP domain-containing protein n=1 Tax=Streptomyces sp. t39 TaxID=1828156 RepID=UPI0011CE0275|nr:CAP domain-containing protein [Streptomyces sp. t39]TXS57108.1 CAP domain-containing protein [Streptomyces sp. t39]
MGRHRRSAGAPVPAEHADGSARRHRGARRKRALPVKTGLLGASAALAVGAVAVTTGLIPGGDTYTIGSSGSDSPAELRTEGPSRLQTQGGASSSPSAEASVSPSRTAEPSRSPSKSPGKKPSATPSKKPAEKTAKPKAPEARRTTPAPEREKAPAPKPSVERPAPTTAAPSGATAAEAAVLGLVNQERALVGCAPVKASTALSNLARAHSEDMAARGFFDHTDPDGATPWDRAEKAGVSGLGGENIARGQADAGAVMNAWMQSEGHRANILNCDFTTMGVGVHMGDGGPWWTQNFGY